MSRPVSGRQRGLRAARSSASRSAVHCVSGAPGPSAATSAERPSARVADDAERRREQLADHGGIDVEVDQRLVRRERQIQQEPLRGALRRTGSRPRAPRPPPRSTRLGSRACSAARRPERIRLRHRAAAHHRRDHRRAEPLARARAARRSRARADDAAARDDERVVARARSRSPRARRARASQAGARPVASSSARRHARHQRSRSASTAPRDRVGRCGAASKARRDGGRGRAGLRDGLRPAATGRKQSIWFGTSWSAPRSRPISATGCRT